MILIATSSPPPSSSGRSAPRRSCGRPAGTAGRRGIATSWAGARGFRPPGPAARTRASLSLLHLLEELLEAGLCGRVVVVQALVFTELLERGLVPRRVGVGLLEPPVVVAQVLISATT